MKLLPSVAEAVRLGTPTLAPAPSRIRLRLLTALLLLPHALAPLGLVAQEPVPPASADSPENESDQLIACLQSDATGLEKTLACKRLAIIGDESAVPALAELLRDQQLSHAARIALEAMPCRAADAALRAAAPHLTGGPLIGVLNSIGVRRDDQAVPLLRQYLSHEDRQVGLAATVALGKIATPEAAETLLELLRDAEEPLKSAAGTACLECGEHLTAAEHAALATDLYDRVAAANVADRIRLAATRGCILGRQPPDVPRLGQLVRDDDPQAFRFALRIARELPSDVASSQLVEWLDPLPADRQPAWIALLADRGEPAAADAVRARVTSQDPEIRTAAIRAIARLGDASDVTRLVQAAQSQDPRVVAAARDALLGIEDPAADAAILACLKDQDLAVRSVLLEVAGLRRITAAVPTLIRTADAADQANRIAAIQALGRTIAPEQLPVLMHRVLSPPNQAEEEAARAALRTACARAVDKDAAARHVTQALGAASEPQTGYLLDVLGVLGSPVALDAVSRRAADHASVEIQDAATRVLGVWPTADVAPVLRDLAQSLDDSRFRIRALRGYLRVARQLDVSEQRRLEICRDALNLAERDEERRLAIETLGRVASVEALRYAGELLESAKLQAVAAQSAIAIGQRLVADHPDDVAAAMRRVLEASRDDETRNRAAALRAAAAER